MEKSTFEESAGYAEEIDDQSFAAERQGGAAVGISSWMGNTGRFCTLTNECMNWCR